MGYVSSKGTYGELKCFIRLFTMLETFSNIYDSYQKILQKFSFHESRLIKRNRASIEISFQSIKQESNTDRIKPRPHDIIPNHFEVFSFFLVQLFMFLWIYIILNTLSLFQLNIIIFSFFIHIYSPKKKKKTTTHPNHQKRKKERKKNGQFKLAKSDNGQLGVSFGVFNNANAMAKFSL